MSRQHHHGLRARVLHLARWRAWRKEAEAEFYEDMQCCAHCYDGELGTAYPYLGAAPHECFFRLGLEVGQSRELPESEWPENFILDPDEGPATGYPRLGVYTHCLHCGAGEPKP